MGVIFVCGVHGVGKTNFCNKLSTELCIPYYSSSKLIKKKNNLLISSVKGEKRVKNISYNQNILIGAVKEILINSPSIILDGHTTILDQNNDITTLPKDLFIDLRVSVFILMELPAKEILQRLLNRDGTTPPEEQIENCKILERKHSEYLAKSLKIPLYFTDGSDMSTKRLLPHLTNIGKSYV